MERFASIERKIKVGKHLAGLLPGRLVTRLWKLLGFEVSRPESHVIVLFHLETISPEHLCTVSCAVFTDWMRWDLDPKISAPSNSKPTSFVWLLLAHSPWELPTDYGFAKLYWELLHSGSSGGPFIVSSRRKDRALGRACCSKSRGRKYREGRETRQTIKHMNLCLEMLWAIYSYSKGQHNLHTYDYIT